MNRIKEAEDYLERLKNAPIIPFYGLKPSDIEDKLAGVYVITNKDTKEVLYVGRTTNLRRRLYRNHLMGNIHVARLKKISY